MATSLKLFVLGILFFITFVFFSYLVHKSLFTQFDFNNTVRLQDRIPRRFDDAFSLFSDIGKFEIMAVVLLGFVVLRRKILAGFAAVSLFVSFHIIEIYGKFFVDHPPPPEFMLRTKQIIDFPQFHVRSEFSYPSGHSGRTVFLSVLIIAWLWGDHRIVKPYKILMTTGVCLFVITMLVSRVYLGEHWTSDVIGGAVLGGGLGMIVAAGYLKNSKSEYRNPKQIQIR